MQTSRLAMIIGIAGLLLFAAGPAWMTLAPGSTPAPLPLAWMVYAAMVGSFMAGTLWGFALPAIDGPERHLALLTAALLMAMSWAALLVPTRWGLALLAAVFVLAFAADAWREHSSGGVDGYLRLRGILTLGALACLLWRALV